MINLSNLAKSGKLGDVYITMHAERVEQLLGIPDFTGGGSRKYTWDNIWRYGDLELGFASPEKELVHIAINFLGENRVPKQGEKLRYNPWIIKGGLSVECFLKACELKDIEYRELASPFNAGCREFLTEAGMHLVFNSREEQGACKGLIKMVVSDYNYLITRR